MAALVLVAANLVAVSTIRASPAVAQTLTLPSQVSVDVATGDIAFTMVYPDMDSCKAEFNDICVRYSDGTVEGVMTSTGLIDTVAGPLIAVLEDMSGGLPLSGATASALDTVGEPCEDITPLGTSSEIVEVDDPTQSLEAVFGTGCAGLADATIDHRLTGDLVNPGTDEVLPEPVDASYVDDKAKYYGDIIRRCENGTANADEEWFCDQMRSPAD